MIIQRIIFDSILFFIVFFLPIWWVFAVVGIALLFLANNFWEIILAGFFIDLLFGGTYDFVIPLPIIYTLGSVLMYSLVTVLKKKLRIYDKR